MSNSVKNAQSGSSVPDWVAPVGIGVAALGGSLAVAYLAEKYSREPAKPDTISFKRSAAGPRYGPSGPSGPGEAAESNPPRDDEHTARDNAAGAVPDAPVPPRHGAQPPLRGAERHFHFEGLPRNPPPIVDAFDEFRRVAELQRLRYQRAAQGADPRPAGGLHDDELDDLPADVMALLAHNNGAELPHDHPFRRAQQRRMNVLHWQQQADRLRREELGGAPVRVAELPRPAAELPAEQPRRAAELPAEPPAHAAARPGYGYVPAAPLGLYRLGRLRLDVHDPERAAEAVRNHGQITDYLRARGLYREHYEGAELEAEKTRILRAIQTYHDEHANDRDFAAFGAIQRSEYYPARPGGDTAIRNAAQAVEQMFAPYQQTPLGAEFRHLPTRNFLIHAWKLTESMPDQAQKLEGQKNIIRALAEAHGYCNTGHITRVLDAAAFSYPLILQPELSHDQANEMVTALYGDGTLHNEFARIFHDGNAQDLQRFLEDTFRQRGHNVPRRHVEAIVHRIDEGGWQNMRELYIR